MHSFSVAPCVSVLSEFSDVCLADERLSERLDRIVCALQARPGEGFPQVMETRADLEGFYRFVENDRIAYDDILAPHVEATLDRAKKRKTTLCIHDTTSFVFGGTRSGMGRTGRGSGPNASRGFFGHFALAVSADSRAEPLGVLALAPWVRKDDTPTRRRKKQGVGHQAVLGLASEQDRWLDTVREVEEMVSGQTSLIHVMDSEADDYKLLANMVSDRVRFVVRLAYDRPVIEDASGSTRPAREFAASKKSVHTRVVKVSTRVPTTANPKKRLGPRRARQATLSFSATAAILRRPTSAGKEHSATLAVNLVRVWEEHPPKGAEPVEWLLLTTEPIGTRSQILRVVDHYRARWLIEEYFKALKTGCAYEKRQLASYDNLLKALAIFVPIAWSLLRLRALSRLSANDPASVVLTELQIRILHATAKPKLPQNPSVGDAARAIARLGGHLPSNGPPGWQTLGRGFSDLIMLERGVLLAKEM